jgi:hypothetical protein
LEDRWKAGRRNIFITFPHEIACGKVMKISLIPDESSLMSHP